MSETQTAPTITGVSAEKYADAVAENRQLAAQVADLSKQIEAIQKNDNSSKIERQVKELSKRAESAEQRAGRLEGSAKRAFTLRHLQGLHNPGAVRLPDVKLSDDGSDLDAASIEALTAWKADNAWAFKAADSQQQKQQVDASQRKTPGHLGGQQENSTTLSDSDLATIQRGGVSLNGLRKAPAGVLASLGLKASN
jgi:hypothetical protein